MVAHTVGNPLIMSYYLPHMDTSERERHWLLEEKYHGEQTAAYQQDVQRLEEGEPLAYLIGHVPFLETTISLESRPLIPRPETEYWVKHIIADIQKEAAPRVLDVCAGSGCIGIAVLAHTFAHVDFAEIEIAHHTTITKNAEGNNIAPDHYRVFGGNLFEHISETYDFILSNPPYIDPQRHTRVQASVREHEPHEALFAKEHGMYFLRQIIVRATKYLSPHGTLVLEHEPEHMTDIQTAGRENGFTEIHTYKDQYGVDRYTRLQR